MGPSRSELRCLIASKVKRLLETTDRSLVESVRLALESAEIDAEILETGVSALPFVPTVISVREEDWERARAVLESLQA